MTGTDEKMGRIVGVGEMLLRASPPLGRTLEAAETWNIHVGGAEANVAVQLARLGAPAAMVTWLPDSQLGWRARRWLQWHGVDVSHVIMVSEGRMGLYFTEHVKGEQSPAVVYDREHTPFRHASQLPVGSLENVRAVHITGITALCAPGLFEAAIDAAASRAVAISYDCNYRPALGPVSVAREAFERAGSVARWIFTSKRDAERVLGLATDALRVAVEIKERFPQTVAVVSDGASGAVAVAGETVEKSNAIATPSLDGIGRGDALCAGFLWGQQHGDLAHALRCGVALAGLSQSYLGDSGWATLPELKAQLDGSIKEPESTAYA